MNAYVGQVAPVKGWRWKGGDASGRWRPRPVVTRAGSGYPLRADGYLPDSFPSLGGAAAWVPAAGLRYPAGTRWLPVTLESGS